MAVPLLRMPGARACVPGPSGRRFRASFFCNQVRAAFDFDATDSSYISLRVGDVVTVVDKTCGDGWWMGRLPNGQQGYFPEAYVEAC